MQLYYLAVPYRSSTAITHVLIISSLVPTRIQERGYRVSSVTKVLSQTRLRDSVPTHFYFRRRNRQLLELISWPSSDVSLPPIPSGLELSNQAASRKYRSRRTSQF